MQQPLQRATLGLVLILFCLPLFVRLGQTDLENDEAIYSFAVDRILETGEWLTPKASPSEDAAFLEKPPLKMWIVAAGIRSGLLPHNEFGLRFWDAAFGSLAMVYTFLIASRLSSALGGLIAALMLFIQQPLLFQHGLRTNNMEAALVLCYCGGLYHFIASTNAPSRDSRWRHAMAVSVYFVLGFMTKFVAALFLPLVIGAATVLFRQYRSAVVRDRWIWTTAAVAAFALIAPWFVYEHLTYGAFFWETIIGVHVYHRFTAFVDPAHLHPWNFYFVQIYESFRVAGVVTLMLAGVALLMFEAAVRRRPEAALVLIWCALPLTLISFGTSKLYHYVYPFLPPLAIGAGVLTARVAAGAQRWFGAFVSTLPNRQVLWPTARMLLRLMAAMALAIAVATVLLGPLKIQIAGHMLLKNGSLVRPWLLFLLLAILGGWTPVARRIAIPLALAALLPLSAYRDNLSLLARTPHPLRSATTCIIEMERMHSPDGRGARGLYVLAPDEDMLHPVVYYFRRIRPWERARAEDILGTSLSAPRLQRPILMGADQYQRAAAQGLPINQTPHLRFEIGRHLLLLLPGPYGVCAVTT
jgi:4-amino-4-deoxy-L-arabinose transferase-like glycosyltransferase